MKLNYLMQASVIALTLTSSVSLLSIAVRPKLVHNNGGYRIDRYVPALVGVPGATDRFTTESVEARVIDTRGNTVGIAAGDVCAYAMFNERETFAPTPYRASNTDLVVCKSGKVFENVATMAVPKTGTPPHIQYRNNYIGQSSLIGEESSRPGAGKKIIYLAQ